MLVQSYNNFLKLQQLFEKIATNTSNLNTMEKKERLRIVRWVAGMHPIFLFINQLQIKHVLICLFFRQHADKNCKRKRPGEALQAHSRSQNLYTMEEGRRPSIH